MTGQGMHYPASPLVTICATYPSAAFQRATSVSASRASAVVYREAAPALRRHNQKSAHDREILHRVDLVHLAALDYVKQKRYGNQEKEQDERDSAGVEAHHQKKPAAELDDCAGDCRRINHRRHP